MIDEYNAKAVEKTTLDALKDFQRETVNRVDALFRSGQRRVLVADEVGLGKTVVARGVIAKTAVLRREEKDDLFKVAYICSSQNIANQNVQKLRISEEVQLDEDITQARLSMQHLKIAQQECNEGAKRHFVVIIPLTPATSFNVNSGSGTGAERALICVILKRIQEFKLHARLLANRLQGGIKNRETWKGLLDFYETEVDEVCKASGGKYPQEFCDRLLASKVRDVRVLVRQLIGETPVGDGDGNPIQNLRFLFATESARMMRPDLVILDEFQRFRYLIKSDPESETGIIADEFLSGKHDDEHQKTRILLLSATPYKLYSTPAEIADRQGDEQYSEFMELLDFLFEGKALEVKKVWGNYSKELHEFRGVTNSLLKVKAVAENRLSGGICRTERVSAMDSGDYISDQASRESIRVLEGDVTSYVQVIRFCRELGLKRLPPIDYVKSCPYLLSYLQGYKLREDIFSKFCGANKKKVKLIRRFKTLSLSKDKIRHFEPFERTNARLEVLKKVAFDSQSERYIWIPPTLPYYSTQGAYKNAYVNKKELFSKVLVFSAWEMVPRMIATLLSYEAECKTTGRLCRNAANRDLGRVDYFKNKYPPPRLRFAIDYKDDPNGKAKSMTLFSLIYPSETLKNFYNPIRCLNSKMSLLDIERDLKMTISASLDTLSNYCGPDSGREDTSWYYLAPMLLDGVEVAREWAAGLIDRLISENDQDSGRGVKGVLANCESLISLLSEPESICLGRRPDDLVDVLVNMVLGSPAVCVLRGWQDEDSVWAATDISRAFFKRFNLTEAIAIIEIVYGRRDDDYWKDILRYCKDGCFQAMFDEYYSVVRDEVAFVSKNRGSHVMARICEALNFRSVPYRVDTAETIEESVYGENGGAVPMRTNFAVGFIKGKGEEAKGAHRKDVIRRSFNSPFRPFVLASTSIGQEGLDFHPYCRKIFHWNLPSNPIDIEQREGRINRYKCLAVRENIALKYGESQTFKKDIWNEMYEAARAGEKGDGVSDLVPFWCFGRNQEVKIERIVPKYPCSKDEAAYQRLVTILSLYRLSMGQPRQEELLEHVLKNMPESERGKLRELFLNLSPFETRRGCPHATPLLASPHSLHPLPPHLYKSGGNSSGRLSVS